jgi:membrane-associated HD superfamily phosphohydrolase
MLADNVEARARSEHPHNESEVEAIVQKGIDYCQAEGQLADTRFTLKDLNIISEVFTLTLTGLYHPRIPYPGSGLPSSLDSPTIPLPKTDSEKK